jgi:hypothetical protein
MALALSFLFATHARADSNDDIAIAVRMQDEQVFVDVSFHVSVTPQEAWAVMTDYDHATDFISKLEKSVILSRTDEMLLVSQKGTMGWGPFSVPIETVTEVRLTPYEKLQGRMISGNMKKNQSTTRLTADAGGRPCSSNAPTSSTSRSWSTQTVSTETSPYLPGCQPQPGSTHQNRRPSLRTTAILGH